MDLEDNLEKKNSPVKPLDVKLSFLINSKHVKAQNTKTTKSVRICQSNSTSVTIILCHPQSPGTFSQLPKKLKQGTLSCFKQGTQHPEPEIYTLKNLNHDWV